MTDDHPPAILEVPSQAVAHLRRSDPHMAALVDRVGELHIPVEPDLWRSLVGAIVGQQLSVAAARTIRGRIAALGHAGFPTAGEILELSDETLRGAGLSRAKVIYIRDLAAHWIDGELNPAEIPDLPDEAVIERLVRVKGSGDGQPRWCCSSRSHGRTCSRWTTSGCASVRSGPTGCLSDPQRRS